MNAVTFFKSMGLKAVKQYLENDNIRTKEMHDELKQIVDAWELVESYGGIESCKNKLYMLHELAENPEPIRDAINLVEQCQND